MADKFDELVELMQHMRSTEGCPWDRQQTIESFKEHFSNEADEVIAAIKANDIENLKEELGDLLWNILFISQIAKEDELFDIHDVMKEVQDKIIRRHPHVFGDKKAKTPQEVLKHWHKSKQEEKKAKFNKRE